MVLQIATAILQCAAPFQPIAVSASAVSGSAICVLFRQFFATSSGFRRF
jgi:hypothetical protein